MVVNDETTIVDAIGSVLARAEAVT